MVRLKQPLSLIYDSRTSVGLNRLYRQRFCPASYVASTLIKFDLVPHQAFPIPSSSPFSTLSFVYRINVRNTKQPHQHRNRLESIHGLFSTRSKDNLVNGGIQSSSASQFGIRSSCFNEEHTFPAFNLIN